MKLPYFDLLSPAPVYIQSIGGIISPTLREISSLGYDVYQSYLTFLLMDLKTCFTMSGNPNLYDALSDAEKSSYDVFDLLTAGEQPLLLLRNILNFFLKGTADYSPEKNGFVIREENRETGIVTRENYSLLCDLICQRNYIKSDSRNEFSAAKSKKALEIMQKLQKGRAAKEKQTKADKNMELANIISAVANKSQNLNILNIWDLTVFQLWDCFSRLTNNSIYDIQSMSVAAWGDKDKHFDVTSWFKRIDTNN